MDFKDVERQTEKRLSKIVVGELNMANEEIVRGNSQGAYVQK